jgi:cold shock CspA family protein
MTCRVVVDVPHRHRFGGNPYYVRIDLTVPGEEIVVNHEASLHSTQQHIDVEELTKGGETRTTHKHARVAISEAFDAAQRLLQDYARRRRGDVKSREAPPRGRVTSLFPGENYGLIEAPDGREIYFHRNSVLNGDFGHLAAGAVVSFVEEQGVRGPQASTVKLVGKHRRRRSAALKT